MPKQLWFTNRDWKNISENNNTKFLGFWNSVTPSAAFKFVQMGKFIQIIPVCLIKLVRSLCLLHFAAFMERFETHWNEIVTNSTGFPIY